jgi:hypothetical protein
MNKDVLIRLQASSFQNLPVNLFKTNFWPLLEIAHLLKFIE